MAVLFTFLLFFHIYLFIFVNENNSVENNIYLQKIYKNFYFWYCFFTDMYNVSNFDFIKNIFLLCITSQNDNISRIQINEISTFWGKKKKKKAYNKNLWESNCKILKTTVHLLLWHHSNTFLLFLLSFFSSRSIANHCIDFILHTLEASPLARSQFVVNGFLSLLVHHHTLNFNIDFFTRIMDFSI